MAELDLGEATDWKEGDSHGRVKLVQNRTYPTSPKRDVLVSGPESIEISINTNFDTSQEASKVYFTTHHGSTKKIIAVLDSDGNLSIAGRLTTDQKYLQF
ncbi:DUF6342 family protein [Kitasatospora sp. NPDC004531]